MDTRPMQVRTTETNEPNARSAQSFSNQAHSNGLFPATSSNTVRSLLPNGESQPSDAVSGFGPAIAQQLQNINLQHLQADAAIQELATGKSSDVNAVVIQMAKADLSFRLALEIRNRLIESYQEIMRLQV